MSTTLKSIGIISVLALAASGARADTGYLFTVNQTTSTLTYQFNASAPFGAGGTPSVPSTLQGQNTAAVAPDPQTRTKRLPSAFTACGTLTATQNDLINISGTIAASGSSPTPSNVHPGGTFKLAVNAAHTVCRLQDLNLNLVANGNITAATNLNNFIYDSFCTATPTCSMPFLVPVSLPLGNATLTSLLVQQSPGVPSSGTLTPNGVNTWNFSVTTNVTVSPTVTFGGLPLAAAPQQMPITLTGAVTINGATATSTASAAINYAPADTVPGVQPGAPFNFTPPTCSNAISVTLTLNILSSHVASNNTANLSAPGARFACPCDTNNSGALEIADIFDFLNLWFAGDPRADFNGSGLSIQDVFDDLNCWFNSPAGC